LRNNLNNEGRYEFFQFVAFCYFALPSMRYANGDGYLRHHRAKQLCVVSPLELIGHNRGSDMAYLQLIQLTF
jgi:hypothetical protein